MRIGRWALPYIFVLAGFVVLGCDNGPCEGDCECTGNDCVCPSTGDCSINCTNACDLQCAGSGDCNFVCSDQCQASCTGSGNCVVQVGDDSTTSCTGSGDCDVTCVGDCVVECPGSGDCLMRCINENDGAECRFERCEGEVTDCEDGVSVCGRSGCP